ncbi:GH92 family glycosyl hydrolase [Flavimarina sp. Hel_I_48]|uniref:GH92 family glycosyl hydrolase n=1 Tax=Flavimarina sp. Hel_I_48 TaxID=1392488 RepID=UPI0004DF6CFD|nr:GH92 family glycosyl hydrolase [Flavimarina sp. Hel_I_48]
MIKKYIFFTGILFLFTACGESEPQTKHSDKKMALIQFVDPFIGTGGHGHTYPGATVPFGMVQPSPDNGQNGWDWCSGYHYSDSLVAGFGQLHLSGTGIGDLADLLFMPATKKIDLTVAVEKQADIPYLSRYSHDNEEAHPGYYRVFLEDPKIDVELTASQRSAYHKYTFQKDDDQSVIVDLGFAINWDRPTETSITLKNPTTITGTRHSKGWAKNQKVFFVAQFSKPIVSHQFTVDGKQVKSDSISGRKTAAQFFFNSEENDSLEVKIALSSVNIANAEENLDAETSNFSRVKKETENTWEQMLSTIEVETPVDSLKTLFYTALYHSHLTPVTFSDKNGEFRLQNDSIAKGDFTAYTTLSLWDTFRAQQPLLTLTNPDNVSDIISSMLAYYGINKKLPVWNLYGNETNTMTGYHSIPIITEAYLKGIKGFDAEYAFEAMKTTMMQDERWMDLYKEYGYIPFDLGNESVTATLEFAYDDWCVAQMAKALGKQKEYEFSLDRSMAFQELYDPETGFMRGKSKDGKWHEPFDPKFSKHETNTDYTEGNAWQHSWFVPHAPDSLIKLMGGNEAFVAKLEQLFAESSEISGDEASPDISGLIGQYAHGNEPSHHIAYLFNKAGAPWRTQYWVHEILKTQYDTTPNGLSGNEDAGQMSAWYVFSSMGLYPMNPASTTYEIGSPIFEKTTLNLPNGNTFTIEAKDVSDTNFYIQSATLNGKEFNQTKIPHSEILNGGTLTLVMGSEPNEAWAVAN